VAALGWLLNLDLAGSIVVATAVARATATIPVYDDGRGSGVDGVRCTIDDDGRADLKTYPEV